VCGVTGDHDATGAPQSMNRPEARSAHVRVENVSVEYATTGRRTGSLLAVEGADLTVAEGEFVCIVGPSGCGKTTLLNAIAGFLPIAGGVLEVDGTAIDGPSPKRAMVFQEANLLPWRTILGNVTYGLDLARPGSRADRKARGQRLLDLVGLSDFGRHYPAELSGGMQQRANLARALAVEPAVLLLDEPFASIDAQTRETMQGELLRICADQAITAVFVTHDIAEAAYLADRVAVFSPRPGSIIHEVSIPFPRPRDQSTRRSPEFQALVDEIADALYGAVQRDAVEAART
jgi:NitT/TauT family transport system ATP-binding protein